MGETAKTYFRYKARGARWATRRAVTREMRRGGASPETIARWHAWARLAACPARDRWDSARRDFSKAEEIPEARPIESEAARRARREWETTGGREEA
jgi:hypothetical protein